MRNERLAHAPTCVRRSPIHGKGVFAAQPIEAGQTIGYFEGHAVARDGEHVLWLDDGSALEVTNDLRFLNHAAEPNADFDGASLEVWASRPIAPGEEITIHYGEDWES
jgi:uncharacterized protein